MPRVGQATFPALAGLGLHVVNVRGDGNCLFRAICDQLYGHQNKHEHIRANVVDYMRQNPNNFKPFVEVDGSQRHAPSRRSAPKGSTKGSANEEIDMAWNQYLASMAKPSTYGDHLALLAVAKTYDMDVMVHHQMANYNVWIKAVDSPTAAPRQIAHIALANEHYQSVRNINGPDNGPARTLPKGMESFEVRMANYLARTGPASTSENSSGASSGTVSPITSVDEPVKEPAPTPTPTSSPAKKRKCDDSPAPGPSPTPSKRQKCTDTPAATPTPAPEQAQAPMPEQGKFFWIDTLDSNS
ncbi:hypothetical protein IFR05_012783 [Cadophora sp. M221]|nr:hypothetical protein IFR05_012783 [Cadophora sp. M221]